MLGACFHSIATGDQGRRMLLVDERIANEVVGALGERLYWS
jgi:hypothetical protein